MRHGMKTIDLGDAAQCSCGEPLYSSVLLFLLGSILGSNFLLLCTYFIFCCLLLALMSSLTQLAWE